MFAYIEMYPSRIWFHNRRIQTENCCCYSVVMLFGKHDTFHPSHSFGARLHHKVSHESVVGYSTLESLVLAHLHGVPHFPLICIAALF